MNEYDELAECIWMQRQLSGANKKHPITTYFAAEALAMDHAPGKPERYVLRVADSLYRLAQGAPKVPVGTDEETRI